MMKEFETTSSLDDQNQKIAFALVQAYTNASLSLLSTIRRRRSTGAFIADNSRGVTYRVLITATAVFLPLVNVQFYVIEEITADSSSTVVSGAYAAGLLQARSDVLMGYLRLQSIATTEVTLVSARVCGTAEQFLAIDLRVLQVGNQAEASDLVKQGSFSRRIEDGLSYVSYVQSVPDTSTCFASDDTSGRYAVCKIVPNADCDITVLFLAIDSPSTNEPLPIDLADDTLCHEMNSPLDMQLCAFALQAFVQRPTYRYPEVATTMPPTTTETFTSTADTTFVSTPDTTVETTSESTVETTVETTSESTVETTAETTFESTVASTLATTASTLVATLEVDSTDSTSCPSIVLTMEVEVYPPWLVALAILFGVLFILLLVIIACWCWKRKAKRSYSIKQPRLETSAISDPIATPRKPSSSLSRRSSPSPPPIAALDPFPIPEPILFNEQSYWSREELTNEVASKVVQEQKLDADGFDADDDDLKDKFSHDENEFSDDENEDVEDPTVVEVSGKSDETAVTSDNEGSDESDIYPVAPFEGYDAHNDFKMETLPRLLFDEDTALAADPISATGDVNQPAHVERLPPISHNTPVIANYSDAQRSIDDALAPATPSVFDQLDDLPRHQRSFDLSPSLPTMEEDSSPPGSLSSPAHHPEPVYSQVIPRSARSRQPPEAFNISSPHEVPLFNPTFSPPEPHGIAMPATHGRNSNDPQSRFPESSKDAHEEIDP